MFHEKFWPKTSALLALLTLALSLNLAQAQTETVLYSFTGANGDGSAPWAGLVMDKKGNLYGTTSAGGAHSWGTVFRLSRSGAETVLYSFGNQSGDGAFSLAGLLMDKLGNLYGTTNQGGPYNVGTVFQLTPGGTETVLYNFGIQGDGSTPYAGLVMDQLGNLSGTTFAGGAYGRGAVYKLTPNKNETVLYSFGTQSADGYSPLAGLVMDKKGNLYGTTSAGGAHNGGKAFKLTAGGTETVLYAFGNQSGDGLYPTSGLVIDKKGNLYGTTYSGGAHNEGAVFQLTPRQTETVLYSFGSQSGDGVVPSAGLVMDKLGNLYGTTQRGGNGNCQSGCGTIFKVTPGGTESVLYSFTDANGDGGGPIAPLVMDKKGNLYGTTFYGGAHNAGAVFKLTP